MYSSQAGYGIPQQANYLPQQGMQGFNPNSSMIASRGVQPMGLPSQQYQQPQFNPMMVNRPQQMLSQAPQSLPQITSADQVMGQPSGLQSLPPQTMSQYQPQNRCYIMLLVVLILS